MGIADNINILLAEDDSDDCFLFQEVLQELNIPSSLRIAGNGEQLMAILDKDVLPDVLFLDLNMPLKNGFVCLDEIRTNKNLAHLPVIIISTSSQQNTIDLVYKKGATHYIVKPSSFQNLKKLIHQALVMANNTILSFTEKENFVLKGNIPNSKTHA